MLNNNNAAIQRANLLTKVKMQTQNMVNTYLQEPSFKQQPPPQFFINGSELDDIEMPVSDQTNHGQNTTHACIKHTVNNSISNNNAK